MTRNTRIKKNWEINYFVSRLRPFSLTPSLSKHRALECRAWLGAPAPWTAVCP